MATNTTTASGVNPPAHRTLNPVLADFLERAGWSAGQVFFATLLAGGTSVTVASLPWKYASVLALSAAVASVVLTAIQYVAKWTNLPFWQDTIVRLAKTFLASLAASFAAAHPFDIVTFNWTTALRARPEPTRLLRGLVVGRCGVRALVGEALAGESFE